MMKIAAAATMVTAAMAAPHNNKFSGAPSLAPQQQCSSASEAKL